MGICLVCEHQFEPFISFGKMPLANGFLTEDEFASESFFELKVGFCANCTTVQLAEVVTREKMFHAQYPFFSSTSVRMAQHFKEFAAYVRAHYLHSTDPFVIEIGSNDGIMLRHFAQKNVRHLGIEPSANVAEAASVKGIQTICEFFDDNLAHQIARDHGLADVFLGANVMCHIPYIHSVLSGIKILLKSEGVLIFEDPYLGDILERTAYDQIYDEHAIYFSASAVSYLAAEHELELIDVAPQNVHGGSMRCVVAHKGAHRVSTSVYDALEKEKALGLHKHESYVRFRRNVERSREELISLLKELKKQGKRIAGYGATSKSTTVTNYCGIIPDLVEYICDTTPIKQGKFSPGVHIPIKPYQEFLASYPDYALLFAWNHGEEIMAKEQSFKNANGKFIVYVPEVRVLA